MGLLRTLLIILFVYYAIKILARLFAPFLIKYASNKAEKHFKEKFNTYHQQQTTYEEREPGAVSIDDQPKNTTKSSKKVGEYIDFEEID